MTSACQSTGEMQPVHEGAQHGLDRAAPRRCQGRLKASLTWAATVWDLVGKSLVTQAVLNPASERPNAARKPAPPAPTTTASNSWSTTGYCVEIWKRKIHSSIAHSTMPDIQAVVTVKELEENKRTQKKVPLSCPESLHSLWDREQQPRRPERRGAPLTLKGRWQSWCQAGPSILGG